LAGLLPVERLKGFVGLAFASDGLPVWVLELDLAAGFVGLFDCGFTSD
jgi:hypothetical protein